MSIGQKWKNLKRKKKRKFQQPGLIEAFLEDSNRKTMTINLYHREIRRLETQFPQIAIRKDKSFNNTDLWECTVFKR